MSANQGANRIDLPRAAVILARHDALLALASFPDLADAAPGDQSGMWRELELNHRFNTLLWNEEDQARRRGGQAQAWGLEDSPLGHDALRPDHATRGR